MQLTGGQYKGRKITTPKGVRPTLSNVRESVFSVLYSYFGSFEDKNFLDLFLGSGIMTFEALSRGFKTVSFELSAQVIRQVKDSAFALGIEPTIIKANSLCAAPKLSSKFDVIYADPPWDYSYYDIFKCCEKLLLKKSLAVIECDKKKKPDVLLELNSFDTLELFREKKYGRCCLLFIKLS